MNYCAYCANEETCSVSELQQWCSSYSKKEKEEELKVKRNCSECGYDWSTTDWKEYPKVIDDNHITITSGCLHCGHEFTETYKIIKVDDVLLTT